MHNVTKHMKDKGRRIGTPLRSLWAHRKPEIQNQMEW
jgi:hypothetical protein